MESGCRPPSLRAAWIPLSYRCASAVIELEQSPSRHRYSRFRAAPARRRLRAPGAGRHAGTSGAEARHPACAEGLRHSGIQRRARHRAHCRQGDDEFPAVACGRAHAPYLGDGVTKPGARRRAAADRSRRRGGDEAAVRLSRRRPAPRAQRRRASSKRGMRWRVLPAALHRARTGGLSRLARVRHRRTRGCCHAAPGPRLDQQCRAWRGLRTGARRPARWRRWPKARVAR